MSEPPRGGFVDGGPAVDGPAVHRGSVQGPAVEGVVVHDVAVQGQDPLPRTGDRQVDESLEQLTGLVGRPTEEQVEIYVGVHRRLQDRLADLDG